MYSIQSSFGYNIHLTALQVVMDRMEQMERSNQQMERSMQQMEISMQLMERSMQQMGRSVEEFRLENQRAMNIGPEMNQEIDTNVYQ